MTIFQSLVTEYYCPVPIGMLFSKQRHFDNSAEENRRKILRYIPFYNSYAPVYSNFILLSKIKLYEEIEFLSDNF